MSKKVYAISMSSLATTHMLIATGTEDTRVRLCDIASGAFTHTLTGHRGLLEKLANNISRFFKFGLVFFFFLLNCFWLQIVYWPCSGQLQVNGFLLVVVLMEQFDFGIFGGRAASKFWISIIHNLEGALRC
jgi:hypothetical protein